MIKNNPHIKHNITMADKINAINGIVSGYFTDGEYTPYFAETAETIAIVNYFIEGVRFEEDEAVYSLVMNDPMLSALVAVFYNPDLPESRIMAFIKENVTDKVSFIKQQILHNHADMDKIIQVCNVIIDSLEKSALAELQENKAETAAS